MEELLVPPNVEDIDFESYTDEELLAFSKEIDLKLKNLETENTVFETFLSRLFPGQLQNIGGITEDNAPGGDAKATDPNATSDPDKKLDSNTTNARSKKKKGTDKKEQDKQPALLSIEEKNEISFRELDELKDGIQKEKEEWAKVLDNHKVIL
jgi:hypothetical protein